MKESSKSQEDLPLIGSKSKGRTHAFKGKTHLEDPRIPHGENHCNFGKSFSISHCNAISVAKTGVTLSDEHRLSISKATTGKKNANYNHDLDREGGSSYRYKVDRLTAINWKLAGNKKPKNGFHLDHKVPVSECFKRGLTPEVCAHICNLQVLTAEENLRKFTSFTIEDLNTLLKESST
ncbi:NUMOD3 domain-containing DNA-binding protein [Acinetobacter sp.]|uniref:NUMOD3 domain-containing DNA-binding protein n=1 Tax=Acinetobacter sp. TaxID=472 RepID=UPI00389109CA